jgi:hypothetical protein
MIPNLIDIDDFTNPFKVVANIPELETRLNDIITEYQPDILKSILGIVEYTNFYNDFTGAEPTQQKWKDFKDGTTYNLVSDNGITVNVTYKGIKPALTYMIYYYYNLSIYTNPIQSGEAKLSMQNSTQRVPAQKMVDSFARGIDYIGKDWNNTSPNSIQTTSDDSEEFEATVFNYLYQTWETEFPDWDFRNDYYINTMNI